MGLKDFLFKDEGEKKPEKRERSAVDEMPTNPTPFIVGEDSDLYQKLLDKTSFHTTAPGTVVKDFLASLTAVPIPDELKLKTAVSQAQQIKSVKKDEILAAFDAMQATLDEERNHFEAAVAASIEDGFNKPTKRAEEISKQIAELQEEQRMLSNQAAETQGQVAKAQAQFSMAYQRRSSEIDKERQAITKALTLG